ncbi:diguanylate cyclase [Helicovermis profundi]|uniref:Diguanylate cyclase n=1 Tax=Helicovermis profundi TaxID=3065157 RepID=A0AAU9EAA9_9FIRM|nr:hypothetical protein HLPR_05500 [Clostridia bacterium S502]
MKKIQIKFRYKFIGAIVLISIIPLIFFSYKSYNSSKKLLTDVEIEKIDTFYSRIINNSNNYFYSSEKDLLYLEKITKTHSSIDSDETSLKNIEKMYDDFISINTRYDQIRLLDLSGMEKIRINNSNGVTIVPKNELQDKSNRYYFKDTIKLRENDIFTSPIDLNVEHGEIEKPNKSVIRFAKVVYIENKPKYVLILNVNTNHIFNELRNLIKNNEFNDTYLIDEKGFYIVNSNKLKEWGGPNNLKTGESFMKDYPVISKKILKDVNNGHIITDSKSYFWKKYYITSSNESYVTIISAIDNNDFLNNVNEFFKKLVYQMIIILILIFIISYFLSKIITNPIYKIVDAVIEIGKGNFDVHFDVDKDSGSEINILAYEIKKMALELSSIYHQIEKRVRDRTKELEKMNEKIKKMAQIDPLTGIYNRHYFNQYVNDVLNDSSENITLIMIDVNDFKYINDNYGHNIGDEILKTVADLLTKAVRESDFVVRYGGDEFLVILYNADAIVAQSYVNRLRLLIFEFNYDNDLINHRLELSLGYDVYTGEKHILEVINSADEKMYKNKIQLKEKRGGKIE